MQDSEGYDDDDNNIADWAHLYEAGAFEDEPMDEAKENAAEDQPPNELGKVLLDTHRDNETMKESVGGATFGLSAKLPGRDEAQCGRAKTSKRWSRVRSGFGEGPPTPKWRSAFAWHKCEGYTAKVQGRRDTEQKRSKGLAWQSARAEAPVEGIRRRRT